jgi:hypothetical protein
MRTYAFAFALGLLCAFSAPTFLQAMGSRGREPPTSGMGADPNYEGRSVRQLNCKKLRENCMNAGEQAQSDCGRYRNECRE